MYVYMYVCVYVCKDIHQPLPLETVLFIYKLFICRKLLTQFSLLDYLIKDLFNRDTQIVNYGFC
jgi:hypothetical protein